MKGAKGDSTTIFHSTVHLFFFSASKTGYPKTIAVQISEFQDGAGNFNSNKDKT